VPGRTSIPEQSGNYVLEFQPIEDGYTIAFLLVTESDHIPLHAPVSNTLEDLPKPLKDPVRARLLLNKIFSLSPEETEAVESLEPVTLKPLNAREKRQFTEWRDKLWKHYSGLGPTLMATEGHILSLQRNALSERQVWQLLIEELRTVVDRFLELGQLTITQTQFAQSFETIKAAMESLGGGVRMNDKPIELQDWSVELTVQATEDGYALTPEIFKNGDQLTQIDWDALIQTQGIFELEDRVEVIPPKTLETVKKLLGQVKEGDEKKLTEKKHLEIPKLEILEWLQLSTYGITVNLPEEIRNYLPNS